jgi:hypothetical protein
VTKAFAAVVAVVAVVAGAIWLVTRSQDSGPDPKAWEQKASAAFKPLVGAVPDLVQGAREWQTGERPTDQFTQQVNAAVTDFERTRRLVDDLGVSPRSNSAGNLYRDSAELYEQVGRIYQVMVGTEPGEVRTQLDLLARRVRELADRVFDRGHAALAPYLDEQQSPDVEVRAPEEVPLWPEEGLAAGPPLDAAPRPAASSPPLRQQTRPEESASAWAKDVRAAHLPAADAALQAAVRSRPADRLADLARRYVAAAEFLRTRPDPKGKRDQSAVLRLGLLVDADAARAAQTASFLQDGPQSALGTVSVHLGAVGEGLVSEAKP